MTVTRCEAHMEAETIILQSAVIFLFVLRLHFLIKQYKRIALVGYSMSLIILVSQGS